MTVFDMDFETPMIHRVAFTPVQDQMDSVAQ